MADTTFTIPDGSYMEEDLERIASATGRTRTDVALEGLAEWLEDQADIVRAEEVLALNEPTISLAEVKRKHGLED